MGIDLGDLIQQRSLVLFEFLQEIGENIVGIIIFQRNIIQTHIQGRAVLLFVLQLLKLFLQIFIIDLLLALEFEFRNQLVGLQGLLRGKMLVQNFLKLIVLARHLLNDFLSLSYHFFIGIGLLLILNHVVLILALLHFLLFDFNLKFLVIIGVLFYALLNDLNFFPNSCD